jgi:hypothetical protein
MEIDARTNGIHSLAESLRAFKKFHENPKDIFSLKDSIMRSHHALETLFKDILYIQDPILLIDEEVRVKKVLDGYDKWMKGEIATVVDELKTISLEETIERLRKFGFLESLTQKEYALFLDSVRKLSFFRNKLQHFSISADPDMIGRILGNVLPRSVDVLETIPYHRMISGIRGIPSSINDDLKKIYEEAPIIIELLRNNYDRLIKEAIEFFKGNTFNDLTLKLNIVYHGRVGTPPYFPELLSTGFINFEYDHSFLARIAVASDIWAIGEEMPYKSEIRMGQPRFQKGSFPDQGIAEGTLEFYAQILLERPDGFLILPDAKEKIAMLRGLTISIKAVLDYKAEALMTTAHYDVRKLLSANGQLNVDLTAFPKGYESEEVELIGKYQEKLDEKNAPFRFDSFLEPDGSLKERSPCILEWNINTKGNIKFA